MDTMHRIEVYLDGKLIGTAAAYDAAEAIQAAEAAGLLDAIRVADYDTRVSTEVVA